MNWCQLKKASVWIWASKYHVNVQTLAEPTNFGQAVGFGPEAQPKDPY